MFSYEMILAAVLVSAAPEGTTQAELQGWYEPLRDAVVCAALESEVLDARERKFVLTSDLEFAADVRTLQGRFRELANAPLLEECQRFPRRNQIVDFLSYNRAYRQDLLAQLALDLVHADELRDAILETDRLHQMWDTLRDARCEYYYITVRRQSLQILREMIGGEAFQSAQMPPHVPLWRFAVSQ